MVWILFLLHLKQFVAFKQLRIFFPPSGTAMGKTPHCPALRVERGNSKCLVHSLCSDLGQMQSFRKLKATLSKPFHVRKLFPTVARAGGEEEDTQKWSLVFTYKAYCTCLSRTIQWKQILIMVAIHAYSLGSKPYWAQWDFWANMHKDGLQVPLKAVEGCSDFCKVACTLIAFAPCGYSM